VVGWAAHAAAAVDGVVEVWDMAQAAAAKRQAEGEAVAEALCY
jgi:hypothetical protein